MWVRPMADLAAQLGNAKRTHEKDCLPMLISA